MNGVVLLSGASINVRAPVLGRTLQPRASRNCNTQCSRRSRARSSHTAQWPPSVRLSVWVVYCHPARRRTARYGPLEAVIAGDRCGCASCRSESESPSCRRGWRPVRNVPLLRRFAAQAYTMRRHVMRWLELRFDFDSTAVRLHIDDVTVT